jgi:HemK-related putative methylase
MGIKRLVGRRLLAWRFRLFQMHRHNHLVLEEIAGRQLVVLPGVFNPKLFRTGEFLARCLGEEMIPPGSRVLDLGTGSGVGAIFAAERAGRVVAVDINPAAVRCARLNALLHGCDHKIDVREGDLFAPVVGETFDVVLFNPPYYRGEPRDSLDQAFRANGLIERFAAGLGAVLAPDGQALLVVSSDMDVADLLHCMRGVGFADKVVRTREFINETMTVYAFERKSADSEARGPASLTRDADGLRTSDSGLRTKGPQR